jgi:hypothetical protein
VFFIPQSWTEHLDGIIVSLHTFFGITWHGKAVGREDATIEHHQITVSLTFVPKRVV